MEVPLKELVLKEEPVSQDREIRRITKDNLSNYHMGNNSFSLTEDQETDQQQHLREEILKYSMKDLQEKLPEVHTKLSEKYHSAGVFDTGRHPFFDVATDIFYQL